MSSYYEAQERIPSQREKIINLLKEAGEEGITNKELNKIGFRFGARIQELHKLGYLIETTSIKKGLYNYVLKSEPCINKYFPNAAEEIYNIIEDQFENAITADQLKNLLDMKFFYIIRKPNWYKNNMRKIH